MKDGITSITSITYAEASRVESVESALSEHIDNAREVITDIVGTQDEMLRLINDLQASHRTMQRMMLVLLGLICLVAVFVGLHFVEF